MQYITVSSVQMDIYFRVDLFRGYWQSTNLKSQRNMNSL